MTVIAVPRYRSLTPAEVSHYLELTGKTYRWILEETFTYHSERYAHDVTCRKGMLSDGATGALDIVSQGWWVHDQLCNTGQWDDGTLVNNWQASRVLGDILRGEGRWARSKYWFWATWFFGGDKARVNGMW